jgi:hypothetical protein
MTAAGFGGCVVVAAALLLLPGCPALAAAPYRPVKPALAVLPAGTNDMLVSVTGPGFGSPGPASALQVVVTGAVGGTTVVNVPSTDPAVQLWSDAQIVVKLSASNIRKVAVVVIAPGVVASPVKAVKYGYETFDTSAAAGVQAGVNGLVIDNDPTHGFNANRVFLNFEFHKNLAAWVPQGSGQPLPGSVQPLPGYPAPAVDIFRSAFDTPTTQSSGGDNAIVDSAGRIWLNEYGIGGFDSPSGAFIPNHSRLLAFDGSAASDQFRLYNIPGDQGHLFAMAWDQTRGRIWFVVQGDSHPRLVVFNPDSPAIPHDDYGFTWTSDKTCVENLCQPLGFPRACQADADCILAEQVCPPGTTVEQATDCYLEIPLEPSFNCPWTIRMLVNPADGTVWMTNYFLGSEIVRFDPRTGTFLHVPLPRPPGKPDPFVGDWPPFPVDLKLTRTGDLVVNTQFGNTLGFISRSTLSNPTTLATSCTQLRSTVPGVSCDWTANWYAVNPPLVDGPDASCVNPCITEAVISGSFAPCTPASRDDAACPWTSPERNGTLYFSWITKKGQVWFTNSYRGIGFINQNDLAHGRQRFVLFPPMSVYPSGPYSCGGDTGNLGAIAVDESTQTVWYAEYCTRRVVRHWPIN